MSASNITLGTKGLLYPLILFLKKIFKRPLQSPEEIDPILVSAFAEGAGELSWIRPSPNKGPVEFFKDELFVMFEEPEKEQQLLGLMNVSGVKSALSILLHVPSWNEKDVLELADILEIAPATALLYGETDYTRCAACVRPSLLKTPVKSFREANYRSVEFYNFISALRKPLNTNGGPSVSMLVLLSLFPISKDVLYEKPEINPYLKKIQSGDYGSLNEIFTFYELQKEFRQTYPTDEDFWNVPAFSWMGSAPSFEAILKELTEKKAKSEGI